MPSVDEYEYLGKWRCRQNEKAGVAKEVSAPASLSLACDTVGADTCLVLLCFVLLEVDSSFCHRSVFSRRACGLFPQFPNLPHITYARMARRFTAYDKPRWYMAVVFVLRVFRKYNLVFFLPVTSSADVVLLS